MTDANSTAAEALAAQYEAHPYPRRDPADEAKRLLTGSPSRLEEIDHYLFEGARDWSRPFRALVAGGGTGDATVMLAQQMADAGVPGEVVYLDRSAAARAMAEARVAARGLTNVRFVPGSLLDVAGLAPGPFDYIDCCGVLHHLEEPSAGLKALTGVLAEDGGLGIMVYAPYGRSGVYELQAALGQLGRDLPLDERVAQARRLLANLPKTNRFANNALLGDHRRSDAELVDLLLNPIDRAFTVHDLARLVTGAGLVIASFIEPLRYEPRLYLADEILRQRCDGLPALEQAALAERLAGNLKTHVAYLARRPGTVARLDGPGWIPRLIEIDPRMLAESLARKGTISATVDGLEITLPVPPAAAALAAGIDGRRSFGELVAALRREQPATEERSFVEAAQALTGALGGLNKLLLRRAG